MVDHGDLVILGSGSTAFAAALTARELGKTAVMTPRAVRRGCWLPGRWPRTRRRGARAGGSAPPRAAAPAACRRVPPHTQSATRDDRLWADLPLAALRVEGGCDGRQRHRPGPEAVATNPQPWDG